MGGGAEKLEGGREKQSKSHSQRESLTRQVILAAGRFLGNSLQDSQIHGWLDRSHTQPRMQLFLFGIAAITRIIFSHELLGKVLTTSL